MRSKHWLRCGQRRAHFQPFVALTDSDAPVASAAREALIGAGGRLTQGDVPALSKALGSESLQTRLFAAATLGTLGPDAKEAVPALANGLSDSAAPFRVEAAEALGSIGSSAVNAVPNLAKALADSDQDVRKQATIALGKIGAGSRTATPALIKVMKTRRSEQLLQRRSRRWAEVPYQVWWTA